MAERIELLNERVVGELSSGYRVDSVCSCVRQLVLNSVEAEAKNISVRIDLAFFHLTVTDDGHGLSRTDLHLLGQRFASSKGVKEDVSRLWWGGRGESLASIISLSRSVHLESKESLEERGYVKTFAGGESRVQETSFSSSLGEGRGCSISVRDFLFNLPVRRGLAEGTSSVLEMERVKGMLEEIILAHPHLSISLYDVSRDTYLLKTLSVRGCIEAFIYLYGAQWKQHLRPFSLQNDAASLRLHGFLSTLGHRNSSLQFVYLGGRRVRMRELSKHLCARMNQHHHFLPSLPVFLMHVVCRRRSVSLSLEEGGNYSVELNDGAREVKTLLDTLFPREEEPSSVPHAHSDYSEVKKDSLQSQVVRRPEQDMGALSLFRSEAKDRSPNDEEVKVKVGNAESKRVGWSGEKVKRALQNLRKYKEEEEMRRPGEEVTDILKPHFQLTTNFGSPFSKRRCQRACGVLEPTPSVHVTKDDLKILTSIGQVDFRFLTAVSHRKLILILDQHAVHERILLEKYCKEHVVDVVLQSPLRMSLQQSLRSLVLQNMENFQKFGLFFVEAESPGEGVSEEERTFDVRVDRVPLCFVNKEASRIKLNQSSLMSQLIKDTLDDVIESMRSGAGSGILPNTINELLKSQACHGAVKFGDALSPAQCATLLQELSDCQLPFQCAHGRPSLLPLIQL